MAKNLVVVESPAKAKTIEKYMGKDFKVLASMGHVRDLPKSDFGLEVNGGVSFSYEPLKQANTKKAIAAIKKASKEVETVWLAPDPDREGEAIAWHVAELINLDEDRTKRVAFNEITKRAVAEAFSRPRSIDMNLVDAQQARRAVDRIVGYKLSPLLWRNVGPNLSAGRVQSAALLIVVEREREIRAFKPQEYWDVAATLVTDDEASFVAVYPVGEKEKFALPDETSANELVERVRPGPWVVDSVRKSERRKKPPAPFKTSTLQQSASSKLAFPAWKTMKVAQSLYERGHITYMRTDSANLSRDALSDAGRVIESQFGPTYHVARRFQEKVKGAQEAHEAIRPTALDNIPSEMSGEMNRDELRLYEMIWQRMVASQMAEAVYDATSVDIVSNGVTFRATGQVLKFDGFMRVYLERSDDEPEEVEGLLPELSEGEELKLDALEHEQHFTQPPPRYTEATLVREMENLGIGRPSTYAPTVQVLVNREYVRTESRRLFPTPRGEVVTELLEAHFPEVVEVDFTARMEASLDEIAEGQKEMQPVVRDFFSSFTAHIDEQKDKMTRPERPTDKTCPECGRPVVQKFGKHGLWFLSCSGWPECGCSNYPDCKYIKREPPKETGESCPNCGSALVQKRGRFGPFVGCSNYPECKYIKKSPRKKATGKKKASRKKTAKKASRKTGPKTPTAPVED